TARAVWDELKAAGFPMDRQGDWANLPRRFMKDTMVAEVAAHAVHRHAPDMLMVHFLCADSHQHLFGPRAPEAYWAIEHVDACIGRLLAALPGNVRERAAVFVVSDHGFLPGDRDIRPNVRPPRRPPRRRATPPSSWPPARGSRAARSSAGFRVATWRRRWRRGSASRCPTSRDEFSARSWTLEP